MLFLNTIPITSSDIDAAKTLCKMHYSNPNPNDSTFKHIMNILHENKDYYTRFKRLQESIQSK